MALTALQQCSSPMLLSPAYGKVYDSKEDMLSGWVAGHDFHVMGGSYCSIRDIERLRNVSSSITLCDFRNAARSTTL